MSNSGLCGIINCSEIFFGFSGHGK